MISLTCINTYNDCCYCCLLHYRIWFSVIRLWDKGTIHNWYSIPITMQIYSRKTFHTLWEAYNVLSSNLFIDWDVHSFSLSVYRWYYGNINRQKAEKLLLAPQNKTGSFLVRISESHSDEYTISGLFSLFFSLRFTHSEIWMPGALSMFLYIISIFIFSLHISSFLSDLTAQSLSYSTSLFSFHSYSS